MKGAVLRATGSVARPILAGRLTTESFRQSIGVSTHPDMDSGPYALTKWDTLAQLAADAGIYWLRQGIGAPSWWEFSPFTLPKAQKTKARGLKILASTYNPDDFDAAPAVIGTTNPLAGRPADVIAAMTSGYGLTLDDFVGIEGPNEYNSGQFHDPNANADWPTRIVNYMAAWRMALNAAGCSLPLLAPSPGNGPAYPDVSASVDAGTAHNYVSQSWFAEYLTDPTHGEIPHVRSWSGNRPVWTTEIGWVTNADVNVPQFYVDEYVQAIYLLRVWLGQYELGMPRTSIYEFADFTPNSDFGLVRNDLTPKHSYVALKNLLTLLGPRTQPYSYAPQTVTCWGHLDRWDWEGTSNHWTAFYTDVLHNLCLQRGDFGYSIVVWRSVPAWYVNPSISGPGPNPFWSSVPDVGSAPGVRWTPAAETITVPLPAGCSHAAVGNPLVGSTFSPMTPSAASVQVQLAEAPLVIHAW